ncbi:hypothetical protein ACFXAZ_36755 [Streptomyces sp. NPDC059477]|uniref:DUF7736 domain-containing protein n=1 Tax=Streptomyces sp. NPDC059477 TaxID=3346847 RepID=UPI0036B20CD9
MATIPLADALSITTDRLVSRRKMAGIYETLRIMTGQDIYTHQLDDVADAVAPALVQQHPFLAHLKPPPGIDAPDLLAWLIEAERVHGETITVEPISDWTHQDPVEGACDKVGAENVFVVKLDPES